MYDLKRLKSMASDQIGWTIAAPRQSGLQFSLQTLAYQHNKTFIPVAVDHLKSLDDFVHPAGMWRMIQRQIEQQPNALVVFTNVEEMNEEVRTVVSTMLKYRSFPDNTYIPEDTWMLATGTPALETIIETGRLHVFTAADIIPDYAMPGTDVHIYLDHSNSLAVQGAFTSAQQLVLNAVRSAENVGQQCYVTTFSHEMGPTHTMPLGRAVDTTLAHYYSLVNSAADGGTDYQVVWDYILDAPKRAAEHAIMVTDFEWFPPDPSDNEATVRYPKNLSYVATSGANPINTHSIGAYPFIKAMRKHGITNIEDRFIDDHHRITTGKHH